MAPSAAYYEWLDAGEPYAPARPIREFVDLLRGAGYTVYHKGDTPHMQANPPEDHTPFSTTGWPLTSARWIGHALDIMPGGGPLGLATLGRRIVAAREAGVTGAMWIKYINWTDGAGLTWHDAWQPDHARAVSTDKGHIHISARSDMDTSDIVSRTGWNPLTGGTMTLTQADVDLILRSDSLPWVDGKQYSVGGALNDTAQRVIAIRDLTNHIDSSVNTLVNRPAQIVTGDQLVTAFVNALLADPTAIDALATAVASRVGMVPTAREIAKAVGELVWHGNAQA